MHIYKCICTGVYVSPGAHEPCSVTPQPPEKERRSLKERSCRQAQTIDMYVYVYVYVCIYIYIYIHIHIHTHMYVYIYMYIYTHMYMILYYNILL